MKVCMVTTGPINGPGGVENVALNISKQLETDGIQTASVHAYEKYSNPMVSVIKFRNVLKKVKKINPDVVHTHDTAGYWIAKSGVDYVHTSHGTWKHCFDYMPRSIKSSFVQKTSDKMLKAVIENAKAAAAISNFVKHYVQDEYKTRKQMQVIHNGVDTKRFRPINGKEEKGTAVWVGTNPVLKGLEVAIKAANIAGVKLIVVGAHGKNTDKIKFVGRVKPELMPKIYASSDALLLPSLFESFPIAPLEAMASGLPVVVSETAHVEIMKNGREGYIVNSSRPEDYAAAIEKAIDKRKRLGKAARRTAMRYDWKKQAALYMKMYDKFL